MPALRATVLLLCTAALLSGCSSPPEDNSPLEPAELAEVLGEEAPAPLPGDRRDGPIILPPQDVRPEEDYVLGPQDGIAISIDDLRKPGQTTTLERVISGTGKIQLPMLEGELTAQGTTTEQLQTAIAAAYQEYLVDPRVAVRVTAYNSKRVTIMGRVGRPQVYSIPRNSVTLIEALSMAGGLGADHGRRAVVFRRTPDGGAEQYLIDLEQLNRPDKPVEDFAIEPGDVLNIPPADRVFIMGYVSRPGEYVLKPGMTALHLVAIAGSWIPLQASPSKAFMRRKRADGTYFIHKLDLNEITEGDERDVVLTPGDTVVVPQSGARFASLEAWSVVKGRLPGVPAPY